MDAIHPSDVTRNAEVLKGDCMQAHTALCRRGDLKGCRGRKDDLHYWGCSHCLALLLEMRGQVGVDSV